MPRTKGFKHSEETKEKLRLSQKGRILTQQQKDKISRSLKGQKFTMQRKENLSLSKKNKPGRKGSLNNNWKGGITELSKQIKKTFEYRQWRSDVFTRDNFTCQDCGQVGGQLEAHHIEAFSAIIEKYQIKTVEQALLCAELWNINNGSTICKKCHPKTKNYGWKARKK